MSRSSSGVGRWFAVPVNNRGSFHFTPAESEFAVGDLGGDDRPPVAPPPTPSAWTTG